MATSGNNLLSFIVFPILTVQLATTGVEREKSLLSAAASCARSRRCGWIMHDKDTYSTRDSADCSEATKSGTDHYNSEMYKKMSNKIQDGEKKKFTQFVLVDPADLECGKVGKEIIGI